ncbi:MAG TPA: outer membrane lipoprotein carrier protein LolA [Candidatus Polarisedimenticolia bacterium]|nr:outer membrane lipoprotein carrier protein LolA [Candidatus Polarisedimenticolia bacterium]
MSRSGFILVILITALPLGVLAAGSNQPHGAALDAAEDDKAPERPADPMLASILEQFDLRQKDTVTMVAVFTERKDLKLLAKPVLSRGEFYYNRPNQVRWEYTEPDRKVFVITEDMYVAYYPALKRAEEVPIKKFVGKRLFRFIGLGQSIDDLGKYYDFRLAPESDIKGTHLLILSPRKKRMKERIAEMKIWVDVNTFLPRQLQYVEADGDSTLLAFQDIQVNVEVASTRFHVTLPKDVVVSETFNGFSLGQQSF